LHLTFSYEEICKYPYYYKDEDLSVTGKVIYEELNSSGNRATLLIQKGNSSEIYGTTYKAEDYSSLLGKTVSCSGSSDGNRKLLTIIWTLRQWDTLFFLTLNFLN